MGSSLRKDCFATAERGKRDHRECWLGRRVEVSLNRPPQHELARLLCDGQRSRELGSLPRSVTGGPHTQPPIADRRRTGRVELRVGVRRPAATFNFGFSRSEARKRSGVGFESAPANGAVLESSGAAAEPAGEHTPAAS